MEISFSTDVVTTGSLLRFPVEAYEIQEVGQSVRVGTGAEQVYSAGDSGTGLIYLTGTPN